MSIRNANSATGDGGASVNGACGGNQAFGSNGIGQVTDGTQITLSFNYAAGHASANNAIRMAYSCLDTTPADLAAETATLTQAEHGCTGTVSGAAATYTDNGKDGGIPAPNAVVDGGYTVTCTLPSKIGVEAGVEEGSQCTISLVDQRDWGGCVDFTLAAEEVIPPPPAPPTPSPAGYYFLKAEYLNDNSASTFSCCNFSTGLVAVPSYDALSASSIEAKLDGRLENCRTSDSVTAPYDDVYVYEDLKIKLSQTSGTSKYSGIAELGGQDFVVDLEEGVISYYHQPRSTTEQPIMCDGTAFATDAQLGDPETTPKPALALGVGTAGNLGADSGSGLGSAATAVIVLAVLGTIGTLGAYAYCRNKKKPPAPPGGEFKSGTAQLTAMPPPPPPDGTKPLPPGWSMATDPSTNHVYYVHAATGQSQWTPPENPHV